MNTSLRVLCASFFVVAAAHAADWPQWRGPNRDAIVKDPAHTLDKLPTDPKVLWKIDAGPGQSSPVISAGKVVLLDAQKDQEVAHCYDAATGKVLWETPVGPTVDFSPAYGGGPRCTPIIDGDRTYLQSSGGEFRCLSMKDGKKIWGVSFGTDYGATFLGNKTGDPAAKETASRRHGNNGSACVDGNRIFVPVGSVNGATLVCFDKMTGKELWKAGNDNTAYSSVQVGTLGGVRQAVHFTADALMGVDAASGKILWRIPLKTGAKRHACTPVIGPDSVVVASTSIGTQKFNITKAGMGVAAAQAWENKQCKTILGTPTLLGKYLFTIGPTDHTDLECLDFATGKQIWAQPGFGDYASLTTVNDKILALNSTGELILIKADPTSYVELGRVQLCAKTWASPAYSDGKIYVKDEGHLTAIALAK